MIYNLTPTGGLDVPLSIGSGGGGGGGGSPTSCADRIASHASASTSDRTIGGSRPLASSVRMRPSQDFSLHLVAGDGGDTCVEAAAGSGSGGDSTAVVIPPAGGCLQPAGCKSVCV